MNDTEEELIAAAFRRQAERAPDITRIQAALRAAERPTTRSWVRWAGLAVAAAAAATAIALPSVLARDLTPTESPATDTGGVAVQPAPVREPGVALPYRPKWLPDGFVEVNRTGGGIHTAWKRTWTSNPRQRAWPFPDGPTVMLGTRPVAATAAKPSGSGEQVVEFNGIKGRLVSMGSEMAEVIWEVSPTQHMVLSVFGGPDSLATARRVAESLEDDPVAAVPTGALEFGWLPEGTVQDVMTIGGDSPQRYLLYRGTIESGDKGIQAKVSWTKPGPSVASKVTETPVTVRGLPGTYTSVGGDIPPAGAVVVQLADGRWLEVSGGPDRAVLLRVAEELKIAPVTPMSWIGAR